MNEWYDSSLSDYAHMKNNPIPLWEPVSETTRMTHRYVDLRRKEVMDVIKLRSDITFLMRKYLLTRDFLEIETPTLFKRTPEGAREFLVPTRKHGKFYSLVQSPQQYKQLLMVGGADRYFQFARCYRDEDLRADRQPEFTQLDMELSFTNQTEIQTLIEELLQSVLKESLGIELKSPFQRMKYEEAMNRYGVDKPDLRFGMTIQHVEPQILAIVLSSGSKFLSRKNVNDFINAASETTEQHGVNAFCAFSSNGKVIGLAENTKKFGVKIDGESVRKAVECNEGDIVVACSGQEREKLLAFLGSVRLAAANALEQEGCILRKRGEFKFLWVEDFPLFEKLSTNEFGPTHHPFTAPVPEDIPLLFKAPEKVRGQHYDLVLNGMEIGGGSIRIHQSEMQRDIIEKILSKGTDNFKHLLDGLSSGCPPHGGIALGYDRFLCAMLGTKSIRDVIAFPKGFSGQELMVNSPANVDDADLAEYGLKML